MGNQGKYSLKWSAGRIIMVSSEHRIACMLALQESKNLYGSVECVNTQ